MHRKGRGLWSNTVTQHVYSHVNNIQLSSLCRQKIQTRERMERNHWSYGPPYLHPRYTIHDTYV